MSPNMLGGARWCDRQQLYIPVILRKCQARLGAWSKTKMSSFEYVKLETGRQGEDKGGDCDIFLLNSLTFTLA